MEPDTVDKNDFVFELKTLPKKTFEIRAIIPWSLVKENRQHALSQIARETEVKGFRKGKAPLDLVEKSIKPSSLLDATLDHLLPNVYQQAIQKYGLKPVIEPKVRAVSTNDNKDWEFIITACEIPEIVLADYKNGSKSIKPSENIWTPGMSQENQKKPTPEEEKNQKVNNLLKWLIENSKFEISELLVENERARKLSRLLESLEKLGLSLEQYLTNTGKTSDQLIAEYNSEAENELRLELIIQKLADAENITVDPAEVDKAIAEAKTADEKTALEKQRYVLSSLIRRQKTLDFLANL